RDLPGATGLAEKDVPRPGHAGKPARAFGIGAHRAQEEAAVLRLQHAPLGAEQVPAGVGLETDRAVSGPAGEISDAFRRLVFEPEAERAVAEVHDLPLARTTPLARAFFEAHAGSR